MLLRWLLAAVHLLALGIGLGSVWVRARLLGGGTLDGVTLRRALAADAWWGVAAALWIGSGLWRLFGATEKTTAYYLGNHVFWTKMALLAAILLLEIRPIVTLSGWRRRLGRNETLDLQAAPGMAKTSYIQAVLVILMVLAATAMARGIGSGAP
jgi:putative membrane protein